MADTDEYFPRGGKKPTTTQFKQNANFLGAPEKRDKKKKKIKKKPEGDDGYLSDEATKEVNDSFKNCAYGVNYKTVKEGLLLLGRVKNVLETKVFISLPCRMIGVVMACHISEPYNKQLEAYVNDQIEQVTDLSEMFRPGQYVAVKVLEVKDKSIMLSMMPQHVNGQKNQAELHKGTLLQAAVSSEEDHGYVMDIGLPDVRAFLPKKNVNPDVKLDTGVVTWCVIKSVSDNSVVTLSNDLAKLQGSLHRKKTNSPMLPGSTLEFVVETPLDNGIEGTVLGDTTAYIQRQHANTVKGKKPALGQKIRARLLYVMPTRNTPFLTMKDIFESTYPDLEEEQKLKDGDFIDDAKVLKITGRSIHFRLRGDCFGTLSLKRIQIDEELTDEEVVAKSYPIGSTHKVRVLCYNLSDYVYSVSDEVDILKEKYFCYSQLSAGELVQASVKAVADNHVLLNVGRMSGYVSQAHLSDSGIFIDPKKSSTSKLPKKKYKVGQAVTARVLTVDPVKGTLFLTLKPSLLAPELEALSSYEQAEIGKAYTGVIKTVRDFVLVSFFNNVAAYVPRQYVTKEHMDNLSDAFHLGQIVNCTILRVDSENKKMQGSLTTPAFWPAKKREGPQKRKINSTDEVPTKRHKTDQIDAEDITQEETDSEEEEEQVVEEKKNKKKKDQEVEEKPKNKKKKDHQEVVEDEESGTEEPDVVRQKILSFSQLSPGELLNASVKTVGDNYMLLNVGKLSGYVGQAHFTDSGISDSKESSTSVKREKKYKVGQAVKARVLTVDPVKGTLFLTLKPSLLAPELEALSSYEQAEVGKAYTGVIRTVRDFVLVSFFDNVAAYVPRQYVTKEHMENLSDAFHLGQIVNCTILRVDPENKKMQGSLTTPAFWPAKKRDLSEKRKLKSTDGVPNKKHKTDSESEEEQVVEEKPKMKKNNELTESRKKDKKSKRKEEVSEESDAIETDIYEDSDQVLTPLELGLIDFSDCDTAKQLKKRIASLQNSINNKTKSIDKIDKKLNSLEEKGLNAENKKFHTALHTEKLVLEERVKKLSEALVIGQKKLEEEDKDEKKKVKEGNKAVKKVDIKVVESLEPALEAPSAKDFWSTSDSAVKTVTQEDSSSSEDEEQEQPKKKRKKLSVAEKLSKVREEEERVRELERRAIESESAPRSTEQFERALLANPNCSQLWIAYMAFHLQATEVEKARAVGRKALNTISFREEDEKLNVCHALINLENRFGTKESQQKMLEEALQINEPFKIHSKLLDIYVETSKHQELTALVDLMMRKYKRDPNTYIMCGTACFKLGLVDKARQVMQKAIAVLEKKEHVTVLVQFALLERNHGARERAEALFEQVLAVYPQRVDVCSSYVDMLIKGGDVDHVRQVMERMTSQKLPARKMKILYKKWIEVEDKIGDQEQVDKIRQRAMDYIEKAKF